MKKTILKHLVFSIISIFLLTSASFAQSSSFEQGKELFDKKNYKEAINIFQSATKSKENKKNPVIWHYLGLSYFNSNNYVSSVDALEKAKKYGKNNPEIWNDLGLAYVQVEKIKKARKAFQKATKLNPKVSSYKANLAFAYIKLGKYNKAQSESNDAIKLNPKNSNAYYFRGVSYLWEGKFEQAESDADKSIELASQFASPYILKSNALLYQFSENYSNEERTKNAYLIKSAVNTLNDCLKKCSVESRNEIQENVKGISVFYEYFSRTTIDNNLQKIMDPDSTGIIILGKPKPGYTDAARQNNVAGTVRVAVLFGKSGKVESTLVLKSLPYGLTRLAVRAAKKIEFVPPSKNGKPYSTIRIVVYNFAIY